MAKTIERRLKVGDWIKPNKEKISTQAKYINITLRNIKRYNEELKEEYTKENYFLVEGNDIKEAENYLRALMNVKVGDYIQDVSGGIDKISEVPEVEHPLEVESYHRSVNTERKVAGSWMWHLNCPDQKVSEERARQYFLQQKEAHQDMVSIFEEKLERLKVPD